MDSLALKNFEPNNRLANSDFTNELTSFGFEFSFPPESVRLRRNERLLKRFSSLRSRSGKFELFALFDKEADEFERRTGCFMKIRFGT